LTAHDHDHDDHEHEHEELSVEEAAWLRAAQTHSCPACGAAGALMLGGGIFCPTCGEITTNPGYQAPTPEK
jgi:ribosomal protein L37AE/L43A